LLSLLFFFNLLAEQAVKLKFSKMHGLGNDFVVLDGIRQQVSLTLEQLQLRAFLEPAAATPVDSASNW